MRASRAEPSCGAHRAAHGQAREQVDPRRHIEPAFGCPEIGEVDDPLLVRALGGELPVKEVRRHDLELPIAAVLWQAQPARPRLQAVQARQPFDLMEATVHPTGEQIAPEPARDVGAVARHQARLWPGRQVPRRCVIWRWESGSARHGSLTATPPALR